MSTNLNTESVPRRVTKRRNPNRHAHESLRDAVDVTRFWRLVAFTGTDDVCWDWLGDMDNDGYGIFVWHGNRRGAHVLSLEFTTGELRGDGMDTRHVCDRPSCVNPSHLSFGTRQENVQDMLDRGRHNPVAKLTEDDVIEMRVRRSAGARQQDLANDFGVSVGMVSMIVRGERWAEAGGPIQNGRMIKTHCKHGHNDWKVNCDGERFCAECARSTARRSRKRAQQITNEGEARV